MPSPLQDEELYPSIPNTYTWSQTEDQLTISFLVPDNFKTEDASVHIEANYVKAGIKDRPPIIKGRLYSTIKHYDSLWQIDKTYNHSGLSSPASSTSSFSFVTPPASPLSSLILPSAASSEYGIDSTGSLSPSLLVPSSKSQSLSSSLHSSSIHSSIHSVPTPPIQRRYRLLTLHLEKAEYLTWPVLIIQGEGNDKFDMDATSLFHWGEISINQQQAEDAFHYHLRAAELGHPRAMVKVAAMYELGSEASTPIAPIYPARSPHKAFEWYKRAADLTPDADGTGSHPDPEACLIVGLVYFNGQTSPETDLEPAFTLEKDYTLALQYFQKTMMLTAPFLDFSRPSPTPPTIPMQRYFCSAAFQAGLVHMQGGHGIDDGPNERMAIEYWRQSSWCGHAESAFNIGILCLNGLPTQAEPEHEVDHLEAGHWFVRAKRLDTDNSIVIPEGIDLSKWDTNKDSPLSTSSKMASSAASDKKKKRKKKKRRSKANSSGIEDDTILWALGAVATAGALVGGWYLWKRGKQD